MSDTPAKQKGGAPTKYSEALAKTICDAIADGVPIKHAATLAGISFQSVCEYKRRYPDFDQRMREALSSAIQSRLAVIRKAMASTDENTALRAATWWLTHVPGAAEHFSESRRVEVTGADGLALGAAVVVYLPTKDGENGGARIIAAEPRKELPDGQRD